MLKEGASLLMSELVGKPVCSDWSMLQYYLALNVGSLVERFSF